MIQLHTVNQPIHYIYLTSKLVNNLLIEKYLNNFTEIQIRMPIQSWGGGLGPPELEAWWDK